MQFALYALLRRFAALHEPGDQRKILRAPGRITRQQNPALQFDQRREQPVFLAPGDHLTFERIDRKTFDRIAAEVEAGTLDWSTLVKE